MISTGPSVRPFFRFLTERKTLLISAPFSRGLMSVFSNIITPQGLEPLQFSPKFRSHSQLDRRTFTALVLNPFLSEEDLLRLVVQDFGVVSREEVKRGALANVSKQQLIDTLNDFLLSLLPLNASALLIIDEAQNLPMGVLEQIRILSNLETDKEKLLQIVLVGQLNFKALLRAPEMRQLTQRVSIRYELKPLNREKVAAYAAHRLTIAGGARSVVFSPRSLNLVQRHSGGIPRLINLLCDRALLGGYSARTNRIGPTLVTKAAEGLDLALPRRGLRGWLRRRLVSVVGVLGAVAVIGATGVGLVYQRARVELSARMLEMPTPPRLASAPALTSMRPPEDDLALKLEGSARGPSHSGTRTVDFEQ